MMIRANCKARSTGVLAEMQIPDEDQVTFSGFNLKLSRKQVLEIH